MMRVATVATPVHARVIAARLGAEGVVCELRGNVDGIYPMGEVHVFVDADDLPTAQELLLADEVESAFDEPCERSVASWSAHRWWVLAVAFVLLAALAFSRAL